MADTQSVLGLNPPKTVRERFFHAFVFEVLAIAICAPLGSWLLGYSLAKMGALTLMISLIAMLWNMVFNALFDQAQKRWAFERTVPVRVAHSLLFEVGLILAVVPLAAWWLGITLVQAFWLDIGIVLFFLPYTFFYNLAYDTLRVRWFRRQRLRESRAA